MLLFIIVCSVFIEFKLTNYVSQKTHFHGNEKSDEMSEKADG